MREIKLRAYAQNSEVMVYQKDFNKWINGFIMHVEFKPWDDDESEFIAEYIWIENQDEEYTASNPPIYSSDDMVKVMQYTGHEDNNGNEIYEGDIDTDGYGNLSVVVYIQEYAAYCFVPIEFYRHGGYESEGMYQFLYDYFFHNMIPNQYAEITGNIYENPELLEVE